MWSSLVRHPRSEDGAVAITTALLLVVLIMMAALVIDIGFLRADHRDSQTVSDLAVTAGGKALGADIDRVTACEEAWKFVVNNLDEADNDEDPTPDDCATVFAGDCDPAVRDELIAPLAGGDIEVVIRMPVFDTDPAMQQTRQAIEPDRDGSPCERISVEVRRTRDHTLAAVAGFDEGSSYAGAVARRIQTGDDELFVSLVVLDRAQCQTIRANGGGLMEVTSFTDPATGEVHPGTITVDSAPSSCGGNNEVFDLDGGGSSIKADGDIFSFGLTDGTPEASVYNSGQVPANLSPEPVPGPLVRREAIDHRYNCEPDAGRYDQVGPEEYRPRSSWVTDPDIDHPGISPCEEGDPSYIRHLYQFLSATIDDVDDTDDDGFVDDNAPDSQTAAEEFDGHGFEVYGDEAGEPCNDVDLVAATTERKWFFDCPTTRVRNGNELRIPQADMVVFRGDVDVDDGATAGKLAVNVDAAGTIGDSDAVVALWDGEMGIQGSIQAERSFVYINRDRLNKTGSGDLFVDAPHGGACGVPAGSFPSPACFEDLAFWQNGFGTGTSDEFNLGGNGPLEVIGTVFVPNANVDVAGSGTTDLEDAQFFAWRFEYSGSATLTLKPNPGRATPIPLFGVGLIR